MEVGHAIQVEIVPATPRDVQGPGPATGNRRQHGQRKGRGGVLGDDRSGDRQTSDFRWVSGAVWMPHPSLPADVLPTYSRLVDPAGIGMSNDEPGSDVGRSPGLVER